METNTIAEIMTRDVFSVAPDTSLETARRLLSTRSISGAPVVAEDGRPLGVITQSDLIDPDRTVSERDGYPLYYRMIDGETTEMGDHVCVGQGRVADVMSPFLLSVAASSSVHAAANVMVSERVHRLLVMDGNKLVGLVSALDLLRALSDKGTTENQFPMGEL